MLEYINNASGLCSAVITMMLLVMAATGKNLRQPVHRWFFVTLVLNVPVLALDVAVGVLMGRTGPVIDPLIRALDFLSYAIAAPQLMAFARYLYAYMNTNSRVSGWFVRVVDLLSAGLVAMAVLAHWLGLYTQFDAQNHYLIQPTYWLSLILPTLAVLTFCAVALQNRRALSRGERATVMAYGLIPMACYAVEAAVPGLWLSYVGSSFALLLVYVNMQVELNRRVQQQETELVRHRVTIMLSQIQPHFLYNSLSAIARLCYDNTEAHTALITFSQYLRVNMNALTQSEPVPFQEELEHVRQYLWLEGLRFEERLRVVYDIRTDQFQMPVLTLQPIVENAVRHGVTKNRQGGAVTIRAEEVDGAYLVQVQDDGPGFDPAQPVDTRQHVGLENVRQRLSATCGGRLLIDSAPGAGATVSIIIPKGTKR